MRVAALVLLIGAAVSVRAQAPTIFDHTTAAGRSVIGAQLAAGQVLSELRLLAISANAQPPNVQQELQRRCTLANDQITTLYRSIQLGANWGALQAQINLANQSILDVSSSARQVAGNDRTLLMAIGRVEFAWQRAYTHLAQAFGSFNPINPGAPVPPPQQNYIANLARALDRQSGVLATWAQSTLPNDLWGTRLEGALRDFSASCDRLSGLIDRGVPFAPALADMQARWEVLSRELGGLQLNQFIALRLQAARVNQLYVALLQALGQQPPPFVFPVNNAKTQGVIAIGAGEGGVPVVRVYSDRRGAEFNDFMAYDPEFRGGVRVAVGDVNGDGIVDVVTAPGQGMPPLVRTFDGRDLSLISQFLAYDQRFLSGVFVAAADVTGNGRAEIVCGAGDPGGPHVRAFDGMTGQVKAEFFAYDQRLQCGARVALGDVDGDRVPDVITTPGPGAPPIVNVFSGRDVAKQLASFHAYDPAFQGGVFVAAADVRRNGRAEVITGAGANGGPHVRIFDPFASRMLQEFYAYDRDFIGGVRLAVCDAVGDGRPDIITAPGPGVAPVVRIFRNRDGQLDREFAAFDPLFRGGAWVAGN